MAHEGRSHTLFQLRIGSAFYDVKVKDVILASTWHFLAIDYKQTSHL